MKRVFTLCFLSIYIFLSMFAQNRENAFEVNQRLGRGINMGNAFEAPSETAWSNPWKPEYFDIMEDLGFKHVRIPIRWEPADRSMANAPYTIYPVFLQRIKEVVDKALDNGMMAIINMHHHEDFFADPAGQMPRFLAQWQQIADFFKDYPEDLLFEVFNEPHGNITPAMWNTMFSDALDVIRVTNPNRVVLMGTADFGGLSGVQHIVLPDDENIILSVHYYSPFEFTHQGAEWVGSHTNEWLGTKWNDTRAERELVISEFAGTIAFSKNQKIPIHVGEFGAYSKADMASRARWTTFMARWFEEQGFSWAYWEFSAGYGIYNPQNGSLYTPLVDALLNNEMPEPVEVVSTPIYQSDFTSGNTGWFLNIQGGAQGNLSNNGTSLVAAVNLAGTQSWHAQLTKGNISLQKDKTYRIVIRGSSPQGRACTVYLGRSVDPWDAYSDYYAISFGTEEREFSYTFTMSKASDAAARLAFDLGTAAGTINLKEVRVELIELASSSPDYLLPDVRVFPNPVIDSFFVTDGSDSDRLMLYDAAGKALLSVSGTTGGINVSHLPKGFYLVELVRNGQRFVFKLVK
ncbi:cellulase family glycosylhydrolase [Alkaliflexus imshenetskii]|uniref:cellulase family glycosylhydrolase n=1 Tax=Alkaliflexus imshenetskii TaxID=286730 RepID=UPI00047C5DDF|nr:cellulase family glycosylhydrolase [Alkaliflexus imshenetskii]